jgi:hypothetical protein
LEGLEGGGEVAEQRVGGRLRTLGQRPLVERPSGLVNRLGKHTRARIALVNDREDSHPAKCPTSHQRPGMGSRSRASGGRQDEAEGAADLSHLLGVYHTHAPQQSGASNTPYRPADHGAGVVDPGLRADLGSKS